MGVIFILAISSNPPSPAISVCMSWTKEQYSTNTS